MEEIKCKQVGVLSGNGYDGMLDSIRRVYSADGASPTVTTCGGGNREPKILVEPHTAALRGRNSNNLSDRTKGAPTKQHLEIGGKVANTLTTVQKDSLVAEPIVIDGFNRSIRAEKDTMGTLTRNCGGDVSTGNGYGIMEINERNERFLLQAIETVNNNDCDSGDTIDAYNKRVNKSGASPALTTRPEGFKTAILPIESTPIHQGQIEVGCQIRVRKLTERECGRLMGIKDEDIDKIALNQSKSSQYHLYGDSIVVNVLMAIFRQML